jgi:hypothetical protein
MGTCFAAFTTPLADEQKSATQEDAWGTGYVVSLQPLQVTIADDPNGNGWDWDDVLPLPEAITDQPGEYLTIETVVVTRAASRSSKVIAHLRENTKVEVIQLSAIESEGKIRAKLKYPDGWISVVSTQNGHRWARPKDAAEAAGQAVYRCTQEVLDRADVGHRDLTIAWRGPVSIFEDKQQKAALDRGVPSWAIDTVKKAQRLTAEKAKLQQNVDDLHKALRDGGRVSMNEEVNVVIEGLEELALQLSAFVPCLVKARAAFDASPYCT